MNHLLLYNESIKVINPEVMDIFNIITDEEIGMSELDYRHKYYIVRFTRPGGMDANKFYDICKSAYDRLYYNDHLFPIDSFGKSGVCGSIHSGNWIPVPVEEDRDISNISDFSMFLDPRVVDTKSNENSVNHLRLFEDFILEKSIGISTMS